MILLSIGLPILLILPSISHANNNDKFFKFPDGFNIGVGGSSYQIEGAWNISDKGLSNWDKFTHEKTDLFANASNGDVACDSYHKYMEDIEIVKNTGFDHYRISLSWPRILPSGFGNEVSKDGIQYYKNVLDALNERGIEPYVTLYHWDHPEVLDRMGGWLNESMVDYFSNYARLVFRELGSRVKFWTTINEPNAFCRRAYDIGVFPPGFNMPGSGQYICGHNMLKAHARAYRIYDEEFRSIQKGQIGMIIHCINFFPLDEKDSESADTLFQFECGWFAHPIFSKTGDYPEIMKQRIGENSQMQGLERSRLPIFSSAWIEYIKGTADYFGLNHYTSRMSQTVPKVDGSLWHNDSGIVEIEHEDWPITVSNWLIVVPEGMRGILNKIKKEFDNPPVYVLENGYPSKGEMFDIERIDYLYSYMKEMFLAIERDGCNVKAYTIWTLLDNFEWNDGYETHFGIVSVNFTDPNRPRTPRASVEWLKDVIVKRKLVRYTDLYQHM